MGDMWASAGSISMLKLGATSTGKKRVELQAWTIDVSKDWWWYDDESAYSPVISGGLVATTRSWWQESGGFDPGMHGWGSSVKETIAGTGQYFCHLSLHRVAWINKQSICTKPPAP